MNLSFSEVNVFTIERSLADKLSVICSKKRFRRVKDLYDVYMFVSLFNIDMKSLQESLKYRKVKWELYPTDEVAITQLGYAYDKLTIGEKDDLYSNPKPSFQDVTAKLNAFAAPFLIGNVLVSTWNFERSRWL